MFVVESSAALPYPPEAVYAALASIESMLRWQAGVRAVRRPRACPPDARFRAPVVLTYRALGARYALTARVIAAEPPHLFAYRADGTAFTFEATYRVEPAPGGTRMVCRVSLTTPASPSSAAPDDAMPAADAIDRRALDCVALRRLLARRVVGDLARLDRWIASRRRAERLRTHTAPATVLPS